MDIAQVHDFFLRSTGVSTDTRKVDKGNLFVALKGPNFNGNAFAQQALEAGAIAAVVDEPEHAKNERCILVEDGLACLQQLANYHRASLKDLTVLGITGSNGKTTTKELIHAVLSTSHDVYATRGNLNNHIGVPLTLLELNGKHRIAIVEMGANKPGDIHELCEIADPDLGIITNIGEAHIEGFGGFDGVLKTKTELYRYIAQKNGLLFVNAGDQVLMDAAKGIQQKTYGIGCGSTKGTKTQHGKVLAFNWNGGAEVITKLFGDHNMTNALAAVAIGSHFNTSDSAMAEGLGNYSPSNNRSQWEETAHNTLIMDAYNANPTSVKAALSSLAAMETERPKLVILGDMFEMGDESERAHKEVLECVQAHQLDAILVGKDFCTVAEGIRAYQTTEELLKDIQSEPITKRCILVKGSRGMKLEQLYEVL